jgi:hypothetical protein
MLLKLVRDVGRTISKVISRVPVLSSMYFLIDSIRAAASAFVLLVVVISEITMVPKP